MTADADREDRLNAALLAYLEAARAGRGRDRAAILEANPDLRCELEGFLDDHDAVERLAAPLRGGDPADGLPADLGELGDFRLVREVGRGGMGVVYEAEQVSLRRRVALKILPFAAAVDPRQLQRFKNEALAAATLHHENIVPVHAVGCERGVHYYAMQFVEGRSLAEFIAEARSKQQTPPGGARGPAESTARAALPTEGVNGGRAYFDWVARLGRCAALALDHAHRAGVVHRDVKPANLLLDGRGTLWVTDFGLARVGADPGLTAAGEVLGTLRYAAPEQALGGVVDHRGDVYSLGATLYELLTLRPVFDGRDRNELSRQIADAEPVAPRVLVPALPPELETVVLKALRKEPLDRYHTALELADDLGRYLDRQPVLARRPAAAEYLWKWARRHPGLVASSVLFLVLLSAGSLLAAALVRAEQGRTRAEQRRAEEAFRGERLRAEEAEAQSRLARRSVDELIRASEEELADRPGVEGVRKRLLLSALGYYQEFLERSRDDPGGRADLLETSRRVEALLADLAAVRATAKLYLLCRPDVLADLRLGAAQAKAVRELTDRVGRQWLASVNDLGRLPRGELARRGVESARANESDLAAILTSGQHARLRQIGLQSEGAAAFRDPEVAKALDLSALQRERLRMIEADSLAAWMRPPDPKRKPTHERISAELTPAQARRWREMTGDPLPVTPWGFPAPGGGGGAPPRPTEP